MTKDKPCPGCNCIQEDSGAEFCTNPDWCCICCVKQNLDRPNCINKGYTLETDKRIIDVTTGDIQVKSKPSKVKDMYNFMYG